MASIIVYWTMCIVLPFVFNTVFITVCAASCYTEATMLFSRQSTLDDLDGPDTVPKTSERARPRLRKMQSMDMSSSSADSGSIVSRCLPHACFVLIYPYHCTYCSPPKSAFADRWCTEWFAWLLEALLTPVLWHDSEVPSQGHNLGLICSFTSYSVFYYYFISFYFIIVFWFSSLIHIFLKVVQLYYTSCLKPG